MHHRCPGSLPLQSNPFTAACTLHSPVPRWCDHTDHSTICSQISNQQKSWFVTSQQTPGSVSLWFMMFVIAGIIVYWAVIVNVGPRLVTRCPSLGWLRGRGAVTWQGFVSFERSDTQPSWWLICVPSEADELSKRRQLIPKLHHIPVLVIHQTEFCICIINCWSFTVCYLNLSMSTQLMLSRNLYQYFRVM